MFLLQIPAMVLFSAIYNFGTTDIASRAFTLCVMRSMPPQLTVSVLPRYDVISILLAVFLLTVRLALLRRS